MSNNIYGAIALTGGTAGALDAIDGTALADKDMAIVLVQGDKVYHYVLDADSAASESSPGIISPDANAGDKRWILHGIVGDMGLRWTPTNLNLGELASITLYGSGATGVLTITSSLVNALDTTCFYSFPDLTSLDLSLITAINTDFTIQANVSLTNVDLSSVVSILDNFSVQSNGSLTDLDLSSLTTVGAGLIISGNGLVTLNLSALVTAGDFLSINGNTSLVTLNLPSFVPTNGYTCEFPNNALSASSVNAILARFVANESYVSGTIDLSGGTSSAPTGQGLTDKATLIARGVTVTTN